MDTSKQEGRYHKEDKVVEDQQVLKVPKVGRVIQHKVVLDQQVITAKVLVVI